MARAIAKDSKELAPGYRTLHLVGQGGQAQVYLAERVRDGQQLALKVLDRSLRQDPVFLERFVREHKLLASLENENIARIFDQGFSGDHPYIAMEFLPGGTLASRIREGIAPRDALGIISQVARALEAIHARGIVHRDLKPANILFRSNGQPVIADFGLARDLAINSTLTIAGQVLATPRYMSPEQCLGRTADHRSDLYAVGAILYEMLTGARLFGSVSPADLIRMHVSEPIPQLEGELAAYQPILERLLAKNPADRFQSARELSAAVMV
jgi:serine/threonine-protein kinase PpkA